MRFKPVVNRVLPGDELLIVSYLRLSCASGQEARGLSMAVSLLQRQQQRPRKERQLFREDCFSLNRMHLIQLACEIDNGFLFLKLHSSLSLTRHRQWRRKRARSRRSPPPTPPARV